MSYTIDDVEAPCYATDGSRGYALTTSWHWLSATHGPQTTTMGGWVDRTVDGDVIVTHDGYPWRVVCRTSEPLTAAWVRQNADAIVAVL